MTPHVEKMIRDYVAQTWTPAAQPKGIEFVTAEIERTMADALPTFEQQVAAQVIAAMGREHQKVAADVAVKRASDQLQASVEAGVRAAVADPKVAAVLNPPQQWKTGIISKGGQVVSRSFSKPTSLAEARKAWLRERGKRVAVSKPTMAGPH